jgi:hypothetical protein
MGHQRCENEDLLRDSRALSPRVQLQLPAGGLALPVFAGFRGESLSLYFGHDPVFHFNSQGELRRAFVDGRIVKAEEGRLVGMQRIHAEHAVELRAQRFSAAEEEQLFRELAHRLSRLRAALASNAVHVEGQIPPNGNAVNRLAEWLAQNPTTRAAASPRVN